MWTKCSFCTAVICYQHDVQNEFCRDVLSKFHLDAVGKLCQSDEVVIAVGKHLYRRSKQRQGSVLSPLLFAVYVDDLAKSCDSLCGVYLVLYADDILLVSSTVTELQNMLHNCERELDALDLVINVKKSCCIRIGQRSNVICQCAFAPFLVRSYHGLRKLNT